MLPFGCDVAISPLLHNLPQTVDIGLVFQAAYTLLNARSDPHQFIYESNQKLAPSVHNSFVYFFLFLTLLHFWPCLCKWPMFSLVVEIVREWLQFSPLFCQVLLPQLIQRLQLLRLVYQFVIVPYQMLFECTTKFENSALESLYKFHFAKNPNFFLANWEWLPRTGMFLTDSIEQPLDFQYLFEFVLWELGRSVRLDFDNRWKGLRRHQLFLLFWFAFWLHRLPTLLVV